LAALLEAAIWDEPVSKFALNLHLRRYIEGGGETSLEFFAQKADAGSFVLGSHQKKRPNCLTVGRFFDYHLFDMVELLVTDYKVGRCRLTPG
jgi:hypothetical protein